MVDPAGSTPRNGAMSQRLLVKRAWARLRTGRLRPGAVARVLALALAVLAGRAASADGDDAVPVLVYHRFGPTVADAMTVRTATFEAQLAWLRDHGHRVIPLRALVDWLRGTGPPPPPRAVVLTADDGHRSVASDMFPRLRAAGFPVTLFVYPSAISNASYALTWEQLAEMQASGLVEVQSHTYWHPKFTAEKKRLSPEDYERFVAMQLGRARETIAARLGRPVDLLAWPFGIHDRDLEADAARAGYVAAFTLERRAVRRNELLFALPRFLVTDADRGPAFAALLAGGADARRAHAASSASRRPGD